MDLLSVLLGSMTTDEASSALAGKTGATSEQSSKLAATALPVMLKSLTSNASASKEGAESLMNALKQHTVQKTMKEQIDEADTEDGAKIVKHILGDKSGDVVQELAAATEMNEEQVTKGLASMAPALLSMVSAAMGGMSGKGSGFDLGSLLGLFGGSQQSAASGLSLMSSLLGGGSKPSGITGMIGSLLGGGSSKPQSSGLLGGMLGSLLGGGSSSSTADTDGTDLLSSLSSLLK